MFGSSTGLFAAFYVLHRLLAPRHPPCALSSLTTLIHPSEAAPSNLRSRIPPRRTKLRRPDQGTSRGGLSAFARSGSRPSSAAPHQRFGAPRPGRPKKANPPRRTRSLEARLEKARSVYQRKKRIWVRYPKIDLGCSTTSAPRLPTKARSFRGRANYCSFFARYRIVKEQPSAPAPTGGRCSLSRQ